jgi:hypothetical protein
MNAAFITTRRVEFSDTDAAGIAHFVAFFRWMEQAEHDLLRSVGCCRMLPGAAPQSLAIPAWYAAKLSGFAKP